MDLDPRKPFTIEAGRAAGLSRRQFGSADYPRVAHGLYVAAGVRTDALLRARPLLGRLTGDPHLSHQTAAELHGLWVPKSALLHVCRDAARKRLRPADIASHQCPCHGDGREPGDIQELAGVPVSSPLKCFRELADVLELVDLVILGDSLVARGFVSPERLVADVADFHGDGAIRARRAASYVRAGVESPPESRSRMLLIAGGLPEPVVNLEVVTRGGRRRRTDLGYKEWKVGGEYEGRHHAEDSAQYRSDIVRREEFDELGWRLILIESHGLYVDPMGTVDRMEAALRQAGWRGPRKPWPDFRRHFPGRPPRAYPA